MSGILRRLDHVAIAVRDTEGALDYFRDKLGLAVAWSEELAEPPVRLTYLDAGNAYIQLVEPLDPNAGLARFIEEEGEGLHHVCFGVDDVRAAAAALAPEGALPVRLGSGRGRVSAFVPGPPQLGVRVECTEFRRAEDIEGTPGWLEG
jgi:methylmalonyl-CoA/ethylmalonyl-CoA epimerase